MMIVNDDDDLPESDDEDSNECETLTEEDMSILVIIPHLSFVHGNFMLMRSDQPNISG